MQGPPTKLQGSAPNFRRPELYSIRTNHSKYWGWHQRRAVTAAGDESLVEVIGRAGPHYARKMESTVCVRSMGPYRQMQSAIEGSGPVQRWIP